MWYIIVYLCSLGGLLYNIDFEEGIVNYVVFWIWILFMFCMYKLSGWIVKVIYWELISDKEINVINIGILIMVFFFYLFKSFGKYGVIYII